jgi:general stress protein 26
MNTNRLEAVSKLDALITDVRYAMLTTMNQAGQLISRPMTMQSMAFDGDLWFLTDRRTHTDGDLQRFPQVNISFSSPSHHRYVSISGRATLIADDTERVKELWNPSYKIWFPGGMGDVNLIVLRVTVHQADYWDMPDHWTKQAITLAQMITGDSTNINSRGHLEM